MARETGSGDKAERSPSNTSKSSSNKTPSSSSNKTSSSSSRAPVPSTKSNDMRLMTNPNMSSSARDRQITPAPRTKSNDMRLMTNPSMSSSARDKQLTPSPRTPSSETNTRRELGPAPSFSDMMSELGPRDTGVTPRPSRERPVDKRIVQTLLGEAANQGDFGLAGVAQTIMNRSQKGGPDDIVDPLDVVLSPWQYSTWNDARNGGNNPQKYQPGDPRFENAEEIWRDVRDNAYDFTGGALNYYNPEYADPKWADPSVPGTENRYGIIGIGDHNYLPTVPVSDRASMAANPALADRISAGGIGPDPVRTAARTAPVPFDRPAGLGGLSDAVQVADAGYARSPFAPSWLKESATVPLSSDGAYGISDMVRAAQSPDTERLVSPMLTAGIASIQPDVGLTMADLGGGPRARPPTVTERTMGGGTGPIDGGELLGDTELATAEPTMWDNVVNMAGGMLDDSLLGMAAKNLFPEVWYGAGETFSGRGTPGSSARLADQGDGLDMWGDPVSPRTANMGSSDSGGGSPGYAYGLEGFIDANGNGVDDRMEGYTAPALAAPVQVASLTPRSAQFPTMPPYRPGIDNEWRYFTGPGYAEGGLVDAMPVEEPVVDSPFAGMDPRVAIIAAAEDALEGDSPNPEEAIKAFVEAFGEEALTQLAEQVKAGMSLKKGKPRVVEGPGGPTDDAVPAMIDGVQPAALSAGEVVIPADAVEAAGGGDPYEGADRLMALSEQLAQSA